MNIILSLHYWSTPLTCKKTVSCNYRCNMSRQLKLFGMVVEQPKETATGDASEQSAPGNQEQTQGIQKRATLTSSERPRLNIRQVDPSTQASQKPATNNKPVHPLLALQIPKRTETEQAQPAENTEVIDYKITQERTGGGGTIQRLRPQSLREKALPAEEKTTTPKPNLRQVRGSQKQAYSSETTEDDNEKSVNSTKEPIQSQQTRPSSLRKTVNSTATTDGNSADSAALAPTQLNIRMGPTSSTNPTSPMKSAVRTNPQGGANGTSTNSTSTHKTTNTTTTASAQPKATNTTTLSTSASAAPQTILRRSGDKAPTLPPSPPNNSTSSILASNPHTSLTLKPIHRLSASSLHQKPDGAATSPRDPPQGTIRGSLNNTDTRKSPWPDQGTHPFHIFFVSWKLYMLTIIRFATGSAAPTSSPSTHYANIRGNCRPGERERQIEEDAWSIKGLSCKIWSTEKVSRQEFRAKTLSR